MTDNVKWAAWGVINIEQLERMQRRNYIKRVREELKVNNLKLHCGGSTRTPWYAVAPIDPAAPPIIAVSGQEAFKRVCSVAVGIIEGGST